MVSIQRRTLVPAGLVAAAAGAASPVPLAAGSQSVSMRSTVVWDLG